MDRVLSPFKRLTGGNLFGQREVERVARGAGVSTEEARRRLREAGMNRGGAVKKMNKGGMPDLTGDGKVTRADVLKGRGLPSVLMELPARVRPEAGLFKYESHP